MMHLIMHTQYNAFSGPFLVIQGFNVSKGAYKNL